MSTVKRSGGSTTARDDSLRFPFQTLLLRSRQWSSVSCEGVLLACGVRLARQRRQSKMRLLASVLFMCVAARAERLLGTETFKEAAEKLITPRNFTMSVTDDDGLEIGRISVR